MKIVVTNKHIKEGDRGSAESCAIALAVRETISKELQAMAKKCKHPLSNFVSLNLEEVEVNSSIDVTINGETKSMKASNKIADFIKAFDETDEKPERADFDFGQGVDEESYKEAMKNWKKAQKVLKPFSFDLKLV